MSVAVDGTVYEIVGPPDSPVIALVHGLGLNRHTFRDHIPALAVGFRVLSYDLFGHGESPVPPETPTLTTYGEQLFSLLNELDITSAHIVGFSLGGMINRRLSADHPEVVDELVILNSPHERSPDAQEAVEQRARDSAAAGPGANIDATLARWFTPGFRESEPERVAEIHDWVVNNDPQTYADCRFVLANGVVELIRPEPPITHRTLVMTCEHDAGSTPAMTEAIASEIPGAATIIVPGLQHLGLIEQPDLFTEPILNFLRSTS
ncbi:MAG: alpha/beta fold hydrolase [Acidimicrobiales bacterium]|nr:MAG: alpha/beta fold hydrolase [Acidimicrobiales bacterium]